MGRNRETELVGLVVATTAFIIGGAVVSTSTLVHERQWTVIAASALVVSGVDRAVVAATAFVVARIDGAIVTTAAFVVGLDGGCEDVVVAAATHCDCDCV